MSAEPELAPAQDPLIGQLIADRYRILSRIGEGGMGRVYLAEHVRMGRKSAVKVINPALATTADAVSRFNREAANACKINHPNVAQVYDFGETADGTLYLAMEFIEGETLDAVIAREGSLPPARAAQITKQIADALYAAHHLDIVHRDLKPENVMIARHLDGTDWVKVVDFGIAKTIQRDGSGSQTVTMAGVSLGTPEYMSPEQLAGEKLDHRTDVYSLGLILFNALTGELPYPSMTSKETLVRRLTARPRALGEVRPDRSWPSGLQETLDRALAPEAADRFDSVAEFGRAVVRAAGETGAADPSSAPTTVVAPPVTPTPARQPPNVNRRPEAPFDRRTMRRALPLAVGAAAVLVTVVLLAQVRMRPGNTAQPPKRDSNVSLEPPVHTVRASDTVHSDTLSRVAATVKLAGTPSAPKPTPRSHAREAGDSVAKSTATPRQRHYWLAPNGDSVDARPLPPEAPAQARAVAAANEIRAHIARMKQLFENGDARGARQEFAMAASELPIIRDLDSDPAHAVTLQRELGQGVRDLVATCYRKRADSTLAPGVRCESLVNLPRRFRLR
ncbi:MAG TPA: serine/threonine-protein kinase [Gemmatimonadaceae bacterium]